MNTYGTSGESVDPASALLAEIARTTAAVEWLAGEVAALGAEALVKGTRYVRTTTDKDGIKTTVAEAGTVRHGLLSLYIEERRHLHELCRSALRLRIDETVEEEVSLLDELAARRAAARMPNTSGGALPGL